MSIPFQKPHKEGKNNDYYTILMKNNAQLTCKCTPATYVLPGSRVVLAAAVVVTPSGK